MIAGAALVACGGGTTPTDTPAPTAVVSHAPSAIDAFKAQYDRVDSDSWEQASLGMKSASTQQQVKDVLAAELAGLQRYRTGITALQPPPDDQLTAPLSRPLAANVAAIDALEAAVRQLQADVGRGDENAFNHDGDSTYTPAYDALIKAGSDLGMAVQVDSAG